MASSDSLEREVKVVMILSNWNRFIVDDIPKFKVTVDSSQGILESVVTQPWDFFHKSKRNKAS